MKYNLITGAFLVVAIALYGEVSVGGCSVLLFAGAVIELIFWRRAFRDKFRVSSQRHDLG